MRPRLEIRGERSWDTRATCQVTPDGHAFEIFVADAAGGSYMLVMTPEEIYRWAETRYGMAPARSA